MPGYSARDLLSAIRPVRRMADGGEAWDPGISEARAIVRAAGNEDAWLADLGQKATAWLDMHDEATAAEAYDAMIRSGISTQDLLDAGISQDTINRALTVETQPEQSRLNRQYMASIAPSFAEDPAMAEQIALQGLPTIQQNARDYIARVTQDGLTDSERQQLRNYATTQGWSFADIQAAGLDPSVLFTYQQPKPVIPPPRPTTPTTGGVTYPGTYAPGEPALDQDFRDSPARTPIPGMPGQYDYTPAAMLTPATGSGLSWTPPTVTSRPRSLLSPLEIKNYGGLTSASQQFAQNLQAQDQELLRAFAESGLPQTSSNYYLWRNRLRGGEFGVGQDFNPESFRTAFGSWAANQGTGVPAAPASPVYYSAPGEYTVRPIDLRGGIFGASDSGSL